MTSIWGSAFGNLIGTLYFLSFQVIGILLMCFFFTPIQQSRKISCQSDNSAFHPANPDGKVLVSCLLCGSVLGSVLLMWLPALFAFFLDFSIAAHVAALLFAALLVCILFFLKRQRQPLFPLSLSKVKAFLQKHAGFWILFVITFVVFAIMLSSHTLSVKGDGLHTGQCTYGDMNMHLGFITSIAGQKTFPPAYSISPGDKLCYPFLCDSISSSIYLLGASLRYAYMLPMLFAFGQVLAGFYALAYSWLKTAGKSLFAWFLFFYNGGLGFVYFLDWSNDRAYSFQSIFTEYYQTPTNLIDRNIRWVNVIVDMLLPQRATLFGYAVLFTSIWLLWRAVFQKEHRLFPLAGLLVGALPMIHTHSFLAVGLISAAWLLSSLMRKADEKKSLLRFPGRTLFLTFLLLMGVLQFLVRKNFISSTGLFLLCIGVLFVLTLSGIYFLCRVIRKEGVKTLCKTWGIYLLIILAAALPQLLFWTFGQTSNSGFLTGHFNWGNLGDDYFWFYIKNWGVILLLLIPAVFDCSRRNLSVLSGAFLIWFVAELISFSPNTYDNNKLLYAAYGFFCCISADYGVTPYQKLKSVRGIRGYACLFLVLAGISGILSIGRELVSDYTCYSNAQIEAADYIEKNAAVDAVFLTNDRHVNEVAALAGRNIVNGSGIYLGPHGIYSQERVSDVEKMYEFPESALDLYEKYQVDYIVISSWERSSYQIDEASFAARFPLWFSNDEIQIYEYVR